MGTTPRPHGSRWDCIPQPHARDAWHGTSYVWRTHEVEDNEVYDDDAHIMTMMMLLLVDFRIVFNTIVVGDAYTMTRLMMHLQSC